MGLLLRFRFAIGYLTGAILLGYGLVLLGNSTKLLFSGLDGQAVSLKRGESKLIPATVFNPHSYSIELDIQPKTCKCIKYDRYIKLGPYSLKHIEVPIDGRAYSPGTHPYRISFAVKTPKGVEMLMRQVSISVSKGAI